MAPPAAPAPPLSAPAPGSARPWAPGSECGRAPCSGHGLGAPGGAGGGRGPSALMPGPAGECWVRGAARRLLLRGRRGCCSGPRASSGAFSLPVGPPAGLGSTEALRPQRSLRSPPPESPPPRPAALWSLRAPLAPAPAPGAHVTGAKGRGQRPRGGTPVASASRGAGAGRGGKGARHWGNPESRSGYQGFLPGFLRENFSPPPGSLDGAPVLLQPALSSGSWWCPSVDLHPQEHLLQTRNINRKCSFFPGGCCVPCLDAMPGAPQPFAPTREGGRKSIFTLATWEDEKSRSPRHNQTIHQNPAALTWNFLL
uniref:uncharacterized protein LOC114673506 n=1 Tax=Macaca mulatta TaxID=9544 RepID=UPI0010A27C3B|nr:uncharacterized protein LOC114673506 [Macaca mulatta]